MTQNIRVMARAMMPGWVKQGLSAARVTQELVNAFGRAYRRTRLLEDYREFRGVIKNESGIRALRKTTLMPKHLMTEATLRLPRRYLVVARGEFHDPATGVPIERHISWYTNNRGTPAEMVAEYLDALAPGAYSEAEIPLTLEIRSIRHNKEMDY